MIAGRGAKPPRITWHARLPCPVTGSDEREPSNEACEMDGDDMPPAEMNPLQVAGGAGNDRNRSTDTARTR